MCVREEKATNRELYIYMQRGIYRESERERDIHVYIYRERVRDIDRARYGAEGERHAKKERK